VALQLAREVAARRPERATTRLLLDQCELRTRLPDGSLRAS
jgi:hypothetical protein